MESYYHDFTFRPLMFILSGGFFKLDNSLPNFTIYWSLAQITYVFAWLMAILGVYTIWHASFDLEVTMQVGNFILFFTGLQIGRAVSHYSEGSLEDTLKLLKEGVFVYSDFDAAEREFRKNIAKNAGFLISVYYKLLFFAFISLAFLLPCIHFCVHKIRAISVDGYEQYLPLPFVMPFRLDTTWGFCTSFVMISFWVLSNFAGAYCHVTLTISTAFQLIGQLDILNISFHNIENRATTGLSEAERKTLQDQLFLMTNFQNRLYFCLRENVLHLQALIRCIYHLN